MTDKLPGVDEHQPAPTTNTRRAIQDLVIEDLLLFPAGGVRFTIADIEARKQIGLQKYGTLLQAFNGRDALMDAYQEALDLCQYLRQVKEEGATWIDVTYNNALQMTLHLRNVIKDRNQ